MLAAGDRAGARVSDGSDRGRTGAGPLPLPHGEGLVLASILNPVESVRILAVFSLEPDLQVLGPVGAYLHLELGTARSIALLIGAIAAWTALPLAIAALLLHRQDA